MSSERLPRAGGVRRRQLLRPLPPRAERKVPNGARGPPTFGGGDGGAQPVGTAAAVAAVVDAAADAGESLAAKVRDWTLGDVGPSGLTKAIPFAADAGDPDDHRVPSSRIPWSTFCQSFSSHLGEKKRITQ